MARFMADRPQPAGRPAPATTARACIRWAQAALRRRQPSALTEEDFRTQSRAKLQEMLLEVSQAVFPQAGQEEIDAKLDEAFEGTSTAERGRRRGTGRVGAQTSCGLEVDPRPS